MFRTELTIAPLAQQLPSSAQVLTLGSCFADSIGVRLAADKVNALVNPFGMVFQPLAVGRLLRAALGEDVDWQQHFVEARGRWQSYDLHGSQGAASPVELLQDIQQTVQRTGEFLRGADAVVLTLGTAWAYRLRETDELVSNCHKMPAELFDKELLTPDEIINSLAETHAYLRRSNSNLRIILTVSPVRHLKDTLPLNAVSKSVLRVACHYLSELLPDVSYFPVYELLTDDLRDYRFYAADMLHPSEVAQDYVWEKFARTYFDADFGRFRKEWAGLRQALGHRPLNARAPEHRQFLESTREQLERLSRQRVNVAAELREVNERLATLPVPTAATSYESAPDTEERVDIEMNAEATTPAEQQNEGPAPATGRTPRLSPEEFRAQRASRNNRPERNRRDGAPRTSLIAAETEKTPSLAPAMAVEPVANAAFVAELSTSLPAAAGAEPEPLKKKKRRSRGGAKRTARKNAAKLATEVTRNPTDETSITESIAITESTPLASPRNPQLEGRKSSVITKSVPVNRGSRSRGRTESTSARTDAAAPDSLRAAATSVGGLPVTEVADQAPAIAPQVPSDAPANVPTAPAANQSAGRRNSVPRTRPLFTTSAATGAHELAPLTNVSVDTAKVPAAPVGALVVKSTRKRPTTVAETPPMVAIVPARTQPRPAGVAAGRMRGSDATLATNKLVRKTTAPKTAVKQSPVPKPASKTVIPKTAAPSGKSGTTAVPTTAPVPNPTAKRPSKPRTKKIASPPNLGENLDLPA